MLYHVHYRVNQRVVTQGNDGNFRPVDVHKEPGPTHGAQLFNQQWTVLWRQGTKKADATCRIEGNVLARDQRFGTCALAQLPRP